MKVISIRSLKKRQKREIRRISASNTGNLMRDVINGTRGNGTMLMKIFNQHQARVYSSIARRTREPADFDVLKADLIKRLEFGKKVINDEKYNIPQRDAVDFTIGIQGKFNELFAVLDAALKPPDAERLKGFVLSVCIDVGRMAQSELEAAIAEHALDRQAASKWLAAHVYARPGGVGNGHCRGRRRCIRKLSAFQVQRV